ncbi:MULTISPECIES: YraN family protein [Paenibacillus]|uniref:YraN family protein n=1 Tax=Paenibacillus TaxID=44249 RepID=UPI000837ACF7|nr:MULTISPECIES: YraN family protein [Paenibacillus]GIP21407.1 UPF0102 protein [Paenibacillus sp. J22TS3]
MEHKREYKAVRKDTRKEQGRYAEELAADYLKNQGYRILARNWRCRTGELDLIAEYNHDIIVVEVRSRSSRSVVFGTAAESVTARKMNQVRTTAAVYLHRVNRSDASVRFDVIAVQFGQAGQLESLDHLKNAF